MHAWNLPKSLVCWFISIMKVFHEGVYKTLLTWMYNQIESEHKENWANQFSIPEKVCHIVPKKSEIQYTHPNVHRVKYCKGKEWKKDLKLGVFAYDNFSPTFHSMGLQISEMTLRISPQISLLQIQDSSLPWNIHEIEIETKK